MYGKTCMVDYDDFMNRYIPPPPGKKEPKSLSSWTTKNPIKPENSRDTGAASINRWLKDANNDDNRAEAGSAHEDGYTVVVTANKVDPIDDTKQRCDLSLYPTACAPQDRDDGANWSEIEVLFECKPHSVTDDPFDEEAEKFEPIAEHRKEILGQIMSYAALIFTKQHRAHLFTVVLFGKMARIIRWDHSGVVVTKKFNYFSEPVKLGRFLWRLCHLSAIQRGHDPTVARVRSKTLDDDLMERRAKKAIRLSGHEIGKHARLLFAQSIANKSDRCKITVDGRYFLVGRPHFASSELAGRGTRCYVAIDCDHPNGPFVYLKDAWRVAHDGIEREGDVLAFLNDETLPGGRVDGVPTLVCHGDVGDQQTVSQDVWKALHPDQHSECPLKTHRHYRIVVEEVCLPMSCFKDAAELVYLIYLCIKAHGQAHKKGVVHRDISAGNVLIYIRESVVDGQLVQERVGILTDWELSKRTDAPDTARQPDRTGTWQFMSAYTLDHLNEPICIADEIEAFFHVLLFYAIRYLRHNIYDVGDFMHTYFDGFERGNGEYYCGEKKRTAMNHGVIRVAGSGRLTFTLPPGFTPPAIGGSPPRETHILNDLIDSLLELFRARYTLHELSKPAPPLGDAGVHPNQASAHTSTHRGRFAGMRQDLAVLHGSNLAGTARLQHVRPKVTPEERAQLETLAAQLHNHKEIEYLYASFFVDEVLQQWPLQDAVPDQLPKDYRPKNDAHASATSRPVTGSKRTVTEDEGDREQQEPKRPARLTRASGKAQLD
ncbi:hypothetical protein OH76DRAFT_1382400 [Lentinus brumalis]|uniref:Fungal-type protein kinase domain-containing protein n=1 Tax=Lentinus brumalis TaxID=2498619 RepID=A0A371D9Z4_9APHY|nr:hypothetical protein OH76DRAFT_1382400 [Polyporus brumalis]